MTTSHAEYRTPDGYVQHWLVAGPRALPANAPAALPAAATGPAVFETAKFQLDADALTWRFAQAGVGAAEAFDHLVDLSGWLRSPAALEAWAYAQVISTSAEVIPAVVTAYAPPQLWLNDALIEPVSTPAADRLPWMPGQWRYNLPFTAAPNTLTLRLTRAAGGDLPLAFALHLAPSAANLQRAALRVRLPLALDPKWLPDREAFESALAAAVLTQAVFTRGQRVGLKFTKHYQNWVRLTARLQTPSGQIFAEAYDVQTAPGRPIQQPLSMIDGAYEIYLQPDTRQYHDEKRLRVGRRLPVFLSNTDFTETPTGDDASRRTAALTHAVRHKGDLYAEIAKLELGAVNQLDARVLTAAAAQLSQPGRSLTQLVALLGVRLRSAAHLPPELLAALDSALLAADLAATPGADEAAQVLTLAAAVLRGQLFAERADPAAEPALLAWLRQRGQLGFAAYNSAATLEAVVVALTHLVALADSDALTDLASVLLDKVFFELAVNSFKGVFGAAHHATSTAAALTGRLDRAAGLTWLLWGQGTLNQHLAGLVSLAVNADYQLPDFIRVVAAHQPSALLHRAAHGPDGHLAHTTTYKTPAFMLSSAQSADPAAPGDREQAWQATLGPDAVVFVNQPANASYSDLHRPNFWRGNLTPPRVAQWNDALIAVYAHPPAGAGLGFTHAHFPVYAFEHHAFKQGWAFAQTGAGYLALTAQSGLTLITTGDAANRELRSPGGANIWLCQLGRAELDGSFSDFQQKILAGPLTWTTGGVAWTTARGDALAWDGVGPLRVNDAPVTLTTVLHLDNPYTSTPRHAPQMDVVLGEQGLRLIFDETSGAA